MSYSVRRIILLLVACVAFFPHNTALSPDIMECRNLVTAREIAAGECTWLVPTMNAELRLEKPPLPTWIAAAVERIAPNSLAMQRIPPALAAMLWTLFLYLFVKRLTDEKTAFVAALAFLTCYQVVLMGRTATWDVYCHAFMTAAIYYLYKLFHDPEPSRSPWRDALLAGLFLGLSFLSKGPVSFFALLLPCVIALWVVYPARLKGKLLPALCVLLIALVVGGWWYLYLVTLHPADLASVFHKETGAWVNRNVRPWWYYWRFWVESGVWAPFVLMGLAVPYWRKRMAQPKAYHFVWLFLVLQLVLLSCMPEKKFRYLLPMMFPMAMLAALVLMHFSHGAKWPRLLLRYTVGVCIVVELIVLPLIGRVMTGDQARTLALLSADERVEDIPFRHPASEELRIEGVYNARRTIQSVDLSRQDDLHQALPCVLLLHAQTADSVLATLPADIRRERIGLYDDNHHAASDMHYSPVMLHVAYLLRNSTAETPISPTQRGISDNE
ncbi:MAG: glycosyltransferase family 39 protein [Bacteroidaceae bacterium]|nr:glycosyltransferase family 39 protein [Bacteroidaceae bacterium]